MERKGPNQEEEFGEGKKEKSGEELGLGLWRLLTGPEEQSVLIPSAPEVEPETTALDSASDMDEAVRLYYRGAAEVNCRNHPDIPSIAECPICACYYCRECMVIKRGKLMCKACAESEFAPTEEEILDRIGKGEVEDSELDFLPHTPPEFNPSGLEGRGEGRVSNVFKRILAFLIDLALLRFLYVLGFALISTLLWGMSGGKVPSVISIGEGNFWVGVKLVAVAIIHYRPLPVILVLDFVYFFLCYTIVNRTIGMSWLNLRIVTIYGDFVTPGPSALRAVILVLSFGVSIIIGLLHPTRMGLHDMLAQTYEINFSGLKRVDAYESIALKL